jgi:hypothetical protein
MVTPRLSKKENSEATRLTCVVHMSHARSKWVTHRLRNSKDVCNTWGSNSGGCTSVVDSSRDVTMMGSGADIALNLNDSANI